MALTLQASDVAGLGDRGSVERVHCRDGSGDGSSGNVYVRYQELGIISCLHYNGWGLHSMQNEQQVAFLKQGTLLCVRVCVLAANIYI